MHAGEVHRVPGPVESIDAVTFAACRHQAARAVNGDGVAFDRECSPGIATVVMI